MSESVKYISKAVKLNNDLPPAPSIRGVRGGYALMREWRVPMRSLPVWHLYWSKTPGAKLIFTDHVISLNADKICLLPPYTVFATDTEQVFEHFFLDFFLDGGFFEQLKREPLLFPASDYMRQIDDCLSVQLSPLSVSSLIFSLLLKIGPEHFVSAAHPAIDQRILQALNRIYAMFDSGRIGALDNRTLSRFAGMSLDNFQHLFRREMKVSPSRYVTNIRLELASKLLKEKNLSIEEISERTGFANRSHFSKVFKATLGVSPAKLRHYR
jgi:AraC-like DNA-binding protein